MEDKLLFLIGSPRSGSTLLSRMLGAHSEIHAPDEPHLITPIAELGYFGAVERAPYDPVITRRAAQAMVAALPGGEAQYLDALRAYTDAIYRGLLEAHTGSVLLDKTPAYALCLDFLARLYPKARYIVLVRNPLAIWSSVVQSFFDGDHEAAHRHNPILERYVPAIGRFLRESPVSHCRVRYESLVQAPETELARICAAIGVEFEPGMVEYGKQAEAGRAAARGLGDPMTVAKESRPTTASLAKWTRELTGRADRVAQSRTILARLTDDDLETWGYPRAQLEAELNAIDLQGQRAPAPKLSRHVLERRLLIRLRRNLHHNRLGRIVRSVREICDVLLR